MGEYRFVPVNQLGSAVGSADAAAKGHAIRSGIRRGWTTAELADSRSREIITQGKELQGRFRLPTKSKRVSSKRSHLLKEVKVVGQDRKSLRAGRRIRSPLINLIGNSLDPFRSFPISQNKQVDKLFYHFLTEFKLNESNPSTKSTWFHYAMQNVTVMHSTIALSAALLMATTPRVGHCDPALQQEGLYQKGQAMRQIREWCLQSNVSYYDSNRASIMISISTMSTVEILYGNFEAAKAHLFGIHQLYEVLNYKQEFSDEYVLRKSAGFADLFLASALGSLPKFPLFHSYDISLPKEIHNEAIRPQPHPIVATQCGRSVAQAFNYLRLAICAIRSGSIPSETIRMLINAADVKLLEIFYGEVADPPPAVPSSIVNLVSRAAHLFLYISIRHFPIRASIVRTMSDRLCDAMEVAIEEPEIWTDCPEVMAWAACVGLVSTWEEAPGISPARGNFLRVLDRLGLRYSRDSLWVSDDSLSSFLWDAERCSPHFQGSFRNDFTEGQVSTRKVIA
ncbi:unnamed protein product [Clonostachys byssicola]|uniref:Uncharacterized protein n=1 Tax=Clonostachys byssicola TaxID=160290 RepID=A0A9N9U9I3_9HYPO|nr:unnamed protein product [Clonostachys byssicola]